MTPQESTLLNDLIRKIQQTQLSEKDPEAEQLLQEGLGNDPDALYMLAQTVLVQNLALDQAKAQMLQLQKQIGELQQRVNQPAKATSFLGSLLGHNDPPPPPPQAQSQPAYAPVTSPPPAYAAPQYQTVPVQQYQQVPVQQSSGPSFLRSAATTAAGVAAGALAFEGVESLLHGFGHPSGFGGGFGPGYGGGFGGAPVEETVINNYYDRPDQVQEHHEREAAYDDRPDGTKYGNASFDPKTDTDDYGDRSGGGRVENASFDPKTDTDDYGSDQADDGSSNDDVAYDDSGDSSGGGDDGGYV